MLLILELQVKKFDNNIDRKEYISILISYYESQLDYPAFHVVSILVAAFSIPLASLSIAYDVGHDKDVLLFVVAILILTAVTLLASIADYFRVIFANRSNRFYLSILNNFKASL